MSFKLSAGKSSGSGVSVVAVVSSVVSVVSLTSSDVTGISSVVSGAGVVASSVVVVVASVDSVGAADVVSAGSSLIHEANGTSNITDASAKQISLRSFIDLG